MELILLAGHTARPQKLALLLRADSKLDTLKFLLKLAWDMKVLDNKKYLAIGQPLSEVGKMLGGWQKQLL